MPLGTYTLTPGLEPGLLNYFIGKEVLPSLLGASGSLYETSLEGLPIIGPGGNVDTFGINVWQSAFDHNTAANPPTPAISRLNGTVQTSNSITIARQNFTRRMGWYTGHAIWDRGTDFIIGKKLNPNIKKILLQQATSDWMKLMVRTFDDIDSVAANNVFANAAANDAALTAGISFTDVVDAFKVLDNLNWQPIDKVMDINNDFSLVATDPAYRLYVHPKQAQLMFSNMIPNSQYVPTTEYLSAAERAKKPDEIGMIFVSGGVSVRVFKNRWIKEILGATAGTANTAGMYNDGTGSNVYHAVLVGSEAWVMPAMGKKVEAKVTRKDGTLDTMEQFTGVDFQKFIPGAYVGNEDGLFDGCTYKFACGESANNQGGFLVPQIDSTGTAVYGAVKIRCLAEEP